MFYLIAETTSCLVGYAVTRFDSSPLTSPRLCVYRTGVRLSGEQMLFDHWLLVEMRGKDPALVGQKLLAVTCGLRARLKALLSGALAEAERRRRTSMTISAGSEGKLKTMSKVRLDDGPEDLPPLLIMAREAWLDGERLSGDDESESGGKRVAEQMQTVDWAQKAEDLSVELADFMLQPIGYDSYCGFCFRA